MRTTMLTRRLFWLAELLLLVGTVACAVWLWRPSEWQPVELAAILFALALLGDWLSIETPSGRLSGSLVGIVLAMGLLGPVPTAAFSIAGVALASSRRQLRLPEWLNALSTFTVVPFTGGLLVRVFAGGVHVHRVPGQRLSDSVVFGLILLGVFVLTAGLNFVLFALHKTIDKNRSFKREVRDIFLPLLPGQLAAGMLATILAVAYASVGLPLLLGAIAVLVILRQLTAALLRSEERAEALQARTIQLVGLQLGILRTLGRALAMRDTTSGRHAAAVAAYSKALAVELGCDEREQETIHAAGLLHDIGKFIWPDRLLEARSIEERDLPLVREHPQEGALLVGALDGYGEVADAIRYHHERMDGRGYPAGLIGGEIPLASRIVGVCSTYDTLTAGRSHRTQMDPEEAKDELRHGAKNGQLDGELVERFISLLEREGATFATNADFETELEFERRVRQMAAPRPADGAPVEAPAHDSGRLRRALSRAG